ncbi:MAG: SDR family NAD(P)-dependent oxidoreductase [Deltaproteobacteria bacterium]|nr:MAG: SDR family NAD(P)-dependent oxidoreductase [Deltaproteobacteria bacterium]
MGNPTTHFSQRYGPWAIVAGASEGLGAAFAESLAQRGVSLVLLARRATLLEQLAVSLRKAHSIEVRTFSLDLSHSEAIQDLCQEIDSLDIGLLVYNAAYAPIGSFAEQDREDLLKVVDVNIRGPLVLSHWLAPRLVTRQRGGLVVMSSLAGLQGSPKLATYAGSKAFGTIFAESLWGELKPHGVDVLASCAGAIRTPGYQGAETGKEAPGTLDASDVAEQTLRSLGKTPRTVPGWVNKVAEWILGRWLPRKIAVAIMKKNTESLS